MSFEYENYGIGESFIPKVYFEKITVDKGPSSYQLKDNVLAYIDDENPYRESITGAAVYNETGKMLHSYLKKNNAKEKTILRIESKILFNIDDRAAFQSVVEDDDFGSSITFSYYVFYKQPEKTPVDDYLETIEGLVKYLSLDSIIENKIKATTASDLHKITFSDIRNQVFNSGASDFKNIKPFDIFKKYEKQLPGGKKYFEIPYSFTLELDSDKPSSVYLLANSLIADFAVNTSYNFGGYFIDDTTTFEEIAGLGDEDIIGGPHTFETVIRNSKIQTVGSVFTISNNQSGKTAGSSPSAAAEKQEANLLREQEFNDIKGLPWFGGVHKHEDRYMTGDTHVDELHPFLDINYVQNRKVIDLRPLKEVKDAQMDFSSLNDLLDLNKIRYGSSNNKLFSLDNLPIFSECFLSTNKEGVINGFFGVDYIKFIRVHGLVPSLLDKLANAEGNALSQFDNLILANMKTILKDQLKIKIIRHGGNEKKIIYDSSYTNDEGVYPALTGEKTDKENVAGPLGFLNPIALTSQSFELSEVSMVEFYTFSDLDKNKQFETDYSYEVEFMIVDPLFVFLKTVHTIFNNAIEGVGKTIGLKQLVSLISTNVKNVNILNEAESPYTSHTYANLLPDTNDVDTVGGNKMIPRKTVLELIEDYDTRNKQSSIGPFGSKDKILGVVEVALRTNFISLLLNSQKENVIIDSEEFNNAIRTAISLADDSMISLDNIVFVNNVFSSLRTDLGNVIDGLSNVNHSKGKDSNYTLNTTVSPSNSNPSLRMVTAKKHFSPTIRKINFGLDYTTVFNSQPTAVQNSLKQISVGDFTKSMTEILLKYFDAATISNKELPVAGSPANIDESGYSFLPLYDKGVILPERLKSSVDENNWSNTLHSLLLFKKNKLAKMEMNNIFSYNVERTTSHYNKHVLNQTVKNGQQMITSDRTVDLSGLIKAERNQTLAADFGLDLQDKVELTQGMDMDNKNRQAAMSAIETEVKSSSTDIKTNYFLSYVNNFSEADLALPNLTSPSGISQTNNIPVQILSLILFKQGFAGLGQPAPNYPFESFMLALFGQESSQMYVSRFAEYFFTFLNFVRIEYLDDFDKFQISSETSDAPVAKTILNVDNISLAAPKWRRLTLNRVLLTPDDKSILCKITNYKVPSLPDNDLRRDLEFFKNFNKYFLITGRDLNTATVNDFGSQLITKGFL